MKKALLLILALLSGCATTAPKATEAEYAKLRVFFGSTVTFDQDLILICGYLSEEGIMACMTQEEFWVRRQAAQAGR